MSQDIRWRIGTKLCICTWILQFGLSLILKVCRSDFHQMMILKYQMIILTVPIALQKKITYQMTMTLNLIRFLKLNWMTLSETSLLNYNVEMLASRLNEKNLLKQEVHITYRSQRNVVFQTCSYVDGLLWFSSNIDGLSKFLSLNHDPAEWRLFIDSSKRNLKAVLLHNGNLKPSIPIAHSVHLHESRGGSRAAATSKMERFVIIVNGWKPLTIITKLSILDVVATLDPPLESYENMNFLFHAIDYERYSRKICEI